jgi:hypothetical protein
MADNRVQAILRKRSAQMYSDMKRRAAKASLTLPFHIASFQVWLESRFDKDGVAFCEYSGEMILIENFSLDHRNPVSRGGTYELTNLAVVSLKENLRKGNMTKGEYLSFRNFVETCFESEAKAHIWKKMEIGDVQRFSHFRRLNKAKKAGRQ